MTVSRDASAEYSLSVPMGSPLNYYGVRSASRGPSASLTDVPDAVGKGR